MNYITYKQIDGTITSGFKVKLYDIVTLNTGLLPSSTGSRHGA